jgi:methionyl-tRNA synthetase
MDNKNEISVEKVIEGYEARLANLREDNQDYYNLMDNFEFSKAFDYAWEKVQAINKRIDDEKPWMLKKSGELEKLETSLVSISDDLLIVNELLKPFLPETTEKISAVFTNKDGIAAPATPLFPKN